MTGTVSFQPFEFNETGIKLLADSSHLKAVPSKFNFSNELTALSSDSLPVVDFSVLTSSDPDRRSEAIHNLAKACQEWGFFILVNHGIAEELMDSMFTATKQFFSLPAGEKQQYEAKSASDPIKCGNFNVADTSNRTITLWRDYLKLYVHPEFHCPHKPQLLRCKSVKHRAVVNSERERISIVVANGPAMEAVVGPAPPLVQKDGRPLYLPMKYVEYVESQLTKTRLNGKSLLEQMMICDDQVAN